MATHDKKLWQGLTADAQKALLTRDVMRSIDRDSYLPSILRTDDKGTLLAEPLKWGGSSDFVSFARATALIKIPSGREPIANGSVVTVLRLPA